MARMIAMVMLLQAVNIAEGCASLATKADIEKMGKDSEMMGVCETTKANLCPGGDLNSFRINYGDYPEKACIAQEGSPTFSSLIPDTQSQVINSLTLTNSDPGSASLSADLKTTVTQTATTTVTNGFSFSDGFSVSIGLSPLDKVGMTSTITTSTSTGKTTSSKHSISLGGTASSPPVEQGESTCATLTADVGTYSVDWTVPVCVSGQVLCNFNPTCHGRHYWFSPIPDGDFCTSISGKTTTNVHLNARIAFSPGVCPSSLESAGNVVLV